MNVKHQSVFNTRFILVDHYSSKDEIKFYGASTEKGLSLLKDNFSIGVWHVKPKNKTI